MRPAILIVSSKVDVATDAVALKLNQMGAVFLRLNTEDFPFSSELAVGFEPGWNHRSIKRSDSTEVVDLSAVRSVWYRRLREPERSAAMSQPVHEFCVREAHAALVGSVLALDARFMSHPSAIWTSEHKVYQLERAQSLGLRVPRTLVTNNPVSIRDAYSRYGGRMIIKPVRSGYIDYGAEQHAVYTNQVLDEHLEQLEAARLSPAIYQELIHKKCDIRVTVVGGKPFVAEIDSQQDPAARVDWRHTEDPDLPHQRASLPPALAEKLLRLLNQLGLEFGAIDLIRTPEDDYVFLEVNPNGQWLWIEDRLEYPISQAIANWLQFSDGKP